MHRCQRAKTIKQEYSTISNRVNKKLDHRVNVCYNSQNQRKLFYKLWIIFKLLGNVFVKTSGAKKGELKNEKKFKNAIKYCW